MVNDRSTSSATLLMGLYLSLISVTEENVHVGSCVLLVQDKGHDHGLDVVDSCGRQGAGLEHVLRVKERALVRYNHYESEMRFEAGPDSGTQITGGDGEDPDVLQCVPLVYGEAGAQLSLSVFAVGFSHRGIP